MTITITSPTLKKTTTITRESLRTIMLGVWGWDQGKADSHLIMLEMSPNVLTITTEKGDLHLQALG